MKKKIILTSVVTIALCLFLIAGSTLALFNDSDAASIVATAGTVDVDASIALSGIWSVKPDSAGTIKDEYNRTYSYQSIQLTDSNNGKFSNDGTASLSGNTLTLTNVTPGDKVAVTVTVKNTSNVATDCNVTFSLVDSNNADLADVINITVDGSKTWGTMGLNSGSSKTMTIVVEVPVNAGNACQGETVSFEISVKAVQANAA